ncbi:hypothetical protein PR202_ga30946 [Eleusine coracana subsp. coracana]|uniref:At1g61320/AtMIF1 LRR domain-containing protein n=1 Tax=Eleusine coracana subsp. coracana TaxID=191504 RepID=A0AAV5DR62_ELECO|nr:hypothetical protein PR202_ga30946 [Eleusine coracana subsp. coracana]
MQMKNLAMFRQNVVCYARAKLSSTMPNLETLVLRSDEEVVNTPMLPTKFIYLKHLTIRLVSGLTFSPSYDYFSLVSFLDAPPSLETLYLDVCQPYMKHETVFGDSTHLRQIPEHSHFYLKSVKIIGFSSAKGLVELACYIIKNAVSLECLTLDTLYGSRCYRETDTTCEPVSDGFLMETPLSERTLRIKSLLQSS